MIKVEHPTVFGDPQAALRGLVPPFYFASIAYGKESIALDLKDPEDKRVFDQLLATADAVVENYRGG